MRSGGTLPRPVEEVVDGEPAVAQHARQRPELAHVERRGEEDHRAHRHARVTGEAEHGEDRAEAVAEEHDILGPRLAQRRAARPWGGIRRSRSGGCWPNPRRRGRPSRAGRRRSPRPGSGGRGCCAPGGRRPRRWSPGSSRAAAAGHVRCVTLDSRHVAEEPRLVARPDLQPWRRALRRGEVEGRAPGPARPARRCAARDATSTCVARSTGPITCTAPRSRHGCPRPACATRGPRAQAPRSAPAAG